jgi:hypothetical protein
MRGSWERSETVVGFGWRCISHLSRHANDEVHKLSESVLAREEGQTLQREQDKQQPVYWKALSKEMRMLWTQQFPSPKIYLRETVGAIWNRYILCIMIDWSGVITLRPPPLSVSWANSESRDLPKYLWSCTLFEVPADFIEFVIGMMKH